ASWKRKITPPIPAGKFSTRSTLTLSATCYYSCSSCKMQSNVVRREAAAQVPLAELVQTCEWRNKICCAGIGQHPSRLDRAGTVSAAVRCVSHLTQRCGPAL